MTETTPTADDLAARVPDGAMIAVAKEPLSPVTLARALIRRGAHGLIPHGRTVLEEGDRLTVIGGPEAIRELAERYETA